MRTTLFTICALSLATATLKAQTISFENNDYKKVSIYDSWAESPFMTGELEGNAQVIDNCYTDEEKNSTSKIVGFQRSRYGSNLMGVRVDLNETFRLTKNERYVHVLIHRPKNDGRAMLITLGKRSERAGQSEDVEQTWSLTSTNAGINGWYDAVFAIKGFSYEDESKDGIDIYSLVVCPDVTDRSSLDEDFACYIDEIMVNNHSYTRFETVYYEINFDASTEVTRTDRYLNSISLSGGEDDTQTYSGLESMIYNNGTTKPVIFNAMAGEKLTPAFSYHGRSMDAYVYTDWGQDGEFSAEVNDNGTIVDGSDLVSYDGYQISGTWYNSDGTNVGSGDRIGDNAGSNLPSFTVPVNTEGGLYRMRYKVDWNSIDPAGKVDNGNHIADDNGGAVVDVLLNVHPSQVSVSQSQLNGEITAADGSTLLDYKVDYNTPLTVKLVPADGFICSGVTVRYGYDLEGDSLVVDNPKWFETYYSSRQFTGDDGDELVLPAEIFRYGSVSLVGDMVSESYLVLHDDEVDNPTLTEVTLTGTNDRAKTFEVEASHSLQDFQEDGQVVAVMTGDELQSTLEGNLYIDTNRDGRFSLVTELFDGSLPDDIEGGIYKAVLDTDPYQLEFLLNVCPETCDVKVNSLNGRLIGRQTFQTSERSYTTGVPETVLPVHFLGLTAQPLVDGYTCGKATVRRGYNLDGEQLSPDGIPQWSEFDVDVADDTGNISVAADSVYGTVIVTADFELTSWDTDFEPSFIDEFDGDEINDTLWTTRSRANATWNRFISTDLRVAYLEDGSLVCRAIANDDLTTDDAAMLTGAKQTSNSFGLLYGYVEVRAITKPHTGNFPAIWMMPMDQSDGWPTCGEIDIWESINTNNTAYHTIHSYWGNTLGNSTNPNKTTNETYNMDGEWHTYGLLKEPGLLTWYVDGTKVFSYAKSTSESDLEQGQWPFDKEFYLILNQSVGDGSWASNYDSSFTYETRFDWARMYTNTLQTSIGSPKADRQADDRVYDLSGRQVTRPQRGVYIKGGKKIVF
ncbi:MAG: glycoside hydrolase family 16 protein [Prevotellaceae bacterium]|nr:glycoside hydrolase family 16 protein [Prevotellaceae bacterium]